MDVEQRLLQHVLTSADDFETALAFGITSAHFGDLDYAEAWRSVVTHHEVYGVLPTPDIVAEESGIQIKPRPSSEPLEWLLDKMRQGRTYGVVVDTIKGAKEEVTKDPDAAVARLRQGLEALDGIASVGHPVIDLHDDWTTWLDDYWAKTLSGYPTGFPTIDYATGGYLPQQLITVVGPPKAGKSTLLLQLAHHANVMHGLRVAFWTFEMSIDEQRLRLACMIAKTDYQKMLNRTATPKEFARVRRALERLEDATPGFFMSADTSGGTTVPMIQAQIRRLAKEGRKPHIVMVDGVYLMDSEVPDAHGMDPKALTSLTRNLKRLGQHEDVSVVISHQVLESRYSRTKGIQSRSIGYSSSFAQDSDTILGVEHPGDDPQQRRLSIVLARNAAPRSTLLEWDWTTSTMEEVDPQGAEEPDDFWEGLDDDD